MADPRPYASATLFFGQLQIAVRLYTAVEPPKSETALLHKSCGSRLRQVLECTKEQIPVSREDTVKGFEFAKDQYVPLPEEKREDDNAPAIELQEFLPQTLNAGLYFDGRSYLGPHKGAERAYRTLALAMSRLGVVGVGQYVARGRTRLVMLIAIGDRLVLQQLHYVDQVRDLEAVPVPDAVVSPPELRLAERLIKRRSRVRFSLAGYVDEDRKRFVTEVTKAVEQHQAAIGGELLAQLKESVGDRRAPAEGRRPRRAP